MNENNMKLCPPAVNYYRQVAALFREDPDVEVRFDEDDSIIKLLVKGQAKADGLELLLCDEKTFGNQKVYVEVIPNNGKSSIADLYRDAFAGNPAVRCIHESHGPVMDGALYILFKPEVVQYVNDDIGDLNRIRSTLYQDLAKEVFESHGGVFFNTAPTGDLMSMNVNLMDISGSLDISEGDYDE